MDYQELKLSNNKVFKVYTFELKSGSHTEKSRLFIPDWAQMVYSEKFLDPIKHLHSIEELDIIHLQLDYYLMNITAPEGILRKDLTHKYSRKFEPEAMLYSFSFNEDLFNLQDGSSKKIKEYIKELSVKQRENRIGEILKTFRIQLLSGEVSIENLIKSAFQNEIINPFSIPGHFAQFSHGELSKVIRARDKFQQLYKKPDQQYYRYIQRLFNEDNDWEFLRELEAIKSILKLAGEIPANPTHTAYDVYLPEIDTLYQNILLELTKNTVRKGIKKKIIQELKDVVANTLTLSPELRYNGVLIFKELFIDRSEARSYLLGTIEPTFKDLVRINSRIYFQDLLEEEKLSKLEKRLFILHNIGIKSLDYRIPLFDKPLVYFLNMSKLVEYLFYDFILKKNPEIDRESANFYLEMQFVFYLKFYKIYVEMIRSDEKEHKQNIRIQNRQTPLKDNLKKPQEQKNDFNFDPDDISFEEQESEEYVVQDDSFLLNSKIYQNEKGLLQTLQKKLSAKEFQLFILHFIEEKTYEDLSKILGIKPESIRKRLYRIRIKYKELQNYFTSHHT